MTAVESADQVSVHLSDCTREAATAVFGVLEAAFPDPEAVTPGGPVTLADTATVWSMAVDVKDRTARGAAAAGALGAPATADLYGAADPVRRVREVLATAFDVEDRGTVSGEHELEARLRLTDRA
ncbi:hypothetical protein [Streptomyces sp. NPDC090022]|uniref:hypothetical protein n=1 Tax=Streptomyces sp. NPDC090022 TaxID=3365920 RepID=UPI00380D25A8